MADQPSPSAAPVRLSEAQERRFRVLRAVLVVCLVGSAVALPAAIAVLVWKGASGALRAVVWGVFIELAGSAAVLGGFARCPACRGRTGSDPGRLLPARCRSCGVTLPG